MEAEEMPGQEEWRTLRPSIFKSEEGLKGGNSLGKPENPLGRGSHTGHAVLLLPPPLEVSQVANSAGLDLRKNQCVPQQALCLCDAIFALLWVKQCRQMDAL